MSILFFIENENPIYIIKKIAKIIIIAKYNYSEIQYDSI